MRLSTILKALRFGGAAKADESVLLAPSQTRAILKERLPIPAWEPLGWEIFDDFLQFWFDHRQGAAPPDWSAFRPEKHPALLPHIILYEKVDDRYFTRIVGDAMNAHLPAKPMGKFLDEVTTRDALDDVVMRLDRTLSDGLPNYVEKARLWQDGQNLFGYNALSLPFTSSGEIRERVFCVFKDNFERSRQ